MRVRVLDIDLAHLDEAAVSALHTAAVMATEDTDGAHFMLVVNGTKIVEGRIDELRFVDSGLEMEQST